MGDVDDVDAFGDDEFEDRVAEQLPRDRDGDGPEAGDLADLVTLDRPAAQGQVIDADDPEMSRGCRLRDRSFREHDLPAV